MAWVGVGIRTLPLLHLMISICLGSWYLSHGVFQLKSLKVGAIASPEACHALWCAKFKGEGHSFTCGFPYTTMTKVHVGVFIVGWLLKHDRVINKVIINLHLDFLLLWKWIWEPTFLVGSIQRTSKDPYRPSIEFSILKS